MPKARLNIAMPIIGLASGKPGEFIDKRSTPDCENVEFSRFTIAKRLGYAAEGESANERILAHGELVSGASRYRFRVGTTKFEEYSSEVWTSRANAALTGTDSETADFTFPLLSAVKVLVYTNGVDAIRKWTGSGNDADLGGTPPKAKYVLAVGPYLMLAHVIDTGTTFHSRVQWCDTGAIETWTGGNSGSTDLIDDEQGITGIALYSDGVTIHKNGSIYVGYLVSTSEVFRFDRRNTGVGAVADATIQNLPNGQQAFLAKDGIHLFNGVTAPLLESDIMDEIREGANPQYVYRSVSKLVREKDEYWVAVPIGSQTEPETVYKYNYRTGQVHKDILEDLTSFGEFEATSQVTWDDIATSWDAHAARWDDVINLNLAPTVTISTSDGRILKRQGIYEDDGEAIDAYWCSKDFTAEDFGLEPGTLMRWSGMELWAKGTDVNISYSTNGGQSFTSLGDTTLSGDYPSDESPVHVYFDVVASRIRFKFRNNDTGDTFTLKQFMPSATVREMRR